MVEARNVVLALALVLFAAPSQVLALLPEVGPHAGVGPFIGVAPFALPAANHVSNFMAATITDGGVLGGEPCVYIGPDYVVVTARCILA